MQIHFFKLSSGLSRPYTEAEAAAFRKTFENFPQHEPQMVTVAIPDEQLTSGQKSVTATVAIERTSKPKRPAAKRVIA